MGYIRLQPDVPGSIPECTISNKNYEFVWAT